MGERFGVEKSCVATFDGFVEVVDELAMAENGLDSSVTTSVLLSKEWSGNLRQKTIEREPAVAIRASMVEACMSHAKRKNVMSSGRDFMSVACLSCTLIGFPLDDKKAIGDRLDKVRMEEST